MANPALSPSQSFLLSQLNHIVLPPRLPAKPESNLVQIENLLHDRLIDASKTIRDSLPSAAYQQWDTIRLILAISSSINSTGAVNGHLLAKELASLTPGTTIILHIAAQNAGLLIR